MKIFICLFFFYINILAQVSVTKTRDLDFGTVFAGESVSITPTNNESAHFVINTSSWSNISIQFVLPDRLYLSSYDLSISFDSNSAGCGLFNNPGWASNFSPHSTKTMNTWFWRKIYVWLGGNLNVPTSQKGGTYNNTVTIIVTKIY